METGLLATRILYQITMKDRAISLALRASTCITFSQTRIPFNLASVITLRDYTVNEKNVHQVIMSPQGMLVKGPILVSI